MHLLWTQIINEVNAYRAVCAFFRMFIDVAKTIDFLKTAADLLMIRNKLINYAN
jgi:hypothetical protein